MSTAQRAGLKVVYEVGRNREAGAHIQVIDNRDGSFEDGGQKWVTLCDTHGMYCEHTTRMLAEQFAHHPTEWCETCRNEGESKSQAPAQAPAKRTAKDERRETDRKVYLAIFTNWAVYASDIVKAEDLSAKEVKNSLARMRKKGLVDSTYVNDDPTPMWQTMFDSENGDTEEEALASFDAAFGVVA